MDCGYYNNLSAFMILHSNVRTVCLDTMAWDKADGAVSSKMLTPVYKLHAVISQMNIIF